MATMMALNEERKIKGSCFYKGTITQLLVYVNAAPNAV